MASSTPTGAYEDRPWSRGREHGYIRAGGGARFKRHLERLAEGGRVWVKVPGRGFVGVGIVTAKAVPYRQFIVKINGTEHPLSELESELQVLEDEYVVAIRWLHTVDVGAAVRGKGLFGNQNTVAQPRDPKWTFTVDVLKQMWSIE